MSSLSIKKLKEGLKSLKSLGHETVTFDLVGCSITLRTLSNPEVRDSQEYCRDFFQEAVASDDNMAVSAWINVQRQEMLAYSIQAIGGIDLQGVKFIETEEMTDEGKPVLIQKHVFVRDLLEDWETTTLEICYRKLRELTEKSEKNALSSVQFLDPADEIESLKRRIQEIRDENGIVDEPEQEDDHESTLNNEAVKAAVFSVQPKEEEAKEDQEESSEHNDTVYLGDDDQPLSGEERAMLQEQERLFLEREQKKMSQEQEDAIALKNKRNAIK